MELQSILFWVFSILGLAGGIGLLLNRNPVHAALSLIVNFFSIAGLYLSLQAEFLAVIQVLVYAGAIMVLFLFVIMLLNLGHEAQRDLKTGAFAVVSAGVAGAMAGILALQLRGSEPVGVQGAGAEAIAAATAEYGAVGAIARPLYTAYVVPFEITGILLLVAIVGAVVLAKRSES